jgi:hypothetical protein
MNILIENKDLKITLSDKEYILTVYQKNIVKIQIQLSKINNKLDYEYSEYQESNKIFHIIFVSSLINCNNNLREFIFDYFDNLEYEIYLKNNKNGVKK